LHPLESAALSRRTQSRRFRVNVKESEGERTEIIRRQFCGARQVQAIFRGAL
jgi:hypothetical protein